MTWTKARWVKTGRCGVAVLTVLTAVFSAVLWGSPVTAAESSKANILFILDASGSMWGRIDGTEKIVIAKKVLNELIQDLPEKVDIGLEVYGHRTKGDCNDIELLVPVGRHSKEKLLNEIQAISPKGKTPITKSIKLAARQVEALEAETTIVLVSDGKETCEGDPCQWVKSLKDRGIRFTMHVVGFDVTGEEQQQLTCIAENGGGRYFTAQNATQLKAALTEVKTEVIQKAELKTEPKPLKTRTKVIKLLATVGHITIPNLAVRKVQVHTPESDGKNEFSEGFVGWITPENAKLEVLPGTYKLKFGNRFFLQDVVVKPGETVERPVGTISLPTLSGRKVEVHDQTSSGKDEYAPGFVGWLKPKSKSLEVPPGTYKLKFGNLFFLEGIEVAAGTLTETVLGLLSIPNLAHRKVEVHAQDFSGKDEYADGFVGWLKPKALTLELPPGAYKLKFGKNYFVHGLEVDPGKTTALEIGALRISNTGYDIEVYALDSDGKNEYTDGFLGDLNVKNPVLELPAGTHKLKIGNQFMEIEVEAGQELLLE